MTVEVGNETLRHFSTTVSKIRKLHDRVLADDRRHEGLDAIVIFVTGDDGSLGVIVVVDELESGSGEVLLGLKPHTGGESIAPEEKSSRLKNAADLGKDLLLEVADDNVGILSQSATRGLGELMSDLHEHGWDGFSTRYWMLAELDPTVYYLSRAAWDPQVTPRSAHDDLFTTITHKQSASDRLWICFGHIEAATELEDFEKISLVAHSLKGGSALIAAEQLSTLSAELERTSREHKKDETAVTFQKLRVELQRLLEYIPAAQELAAKASG